MSTGATIALVVGGVAVAGGAAFLLLRKPVAAAPKPAAAKTTGISAGSIIASVGGALASRLGGDAIDALEDWLS
jgi:hypothetical protein